MKPVRTAVSRVFLVDVVPCSHRRLGVDEESKIQAKSRRLQERIGNRRAIASFDCDTPSLHVGG
jgi:hypothetical protein